ncbi:hypothetical protein [Microbacterium sp. 77mftsu3.1]|uniref:hypothetical protein n=1 Tax=Microbacterium sp. 77mftsu3.1 TaxID=1761802 RepID=UPI0003810F8A|nr:hypothetical protein [Microbacterium sp. 77mftsu3.1]SDH41779.1 hypothetical protein SAMN04488590_3289 [Microbacterium sp. 77mftsu3.1]
MTDATVHELIQTKTRANSAVIEGRKALALAEGRYADAAVEFALAKRLIGQGAARDASAPTLTSLAQAKTHANSKVIAARQFLARVERAYTDAHIELTIARLSENGRLDAVLPEGD